ncbi:MAG: HlyC/CorC family transporter [Burkholderiales bacterium]|nr:HlyC/CorC family transporter [Phycisphaerae bacterium]
MPFLLQLLFVPFLISVNAFFVVAEYALVSVRSGQIEEIKKRHPSAAIALRSLKDRLASAIGTIQICITMTNLLLGAIGEPAMTKIILMAFSSLEDVPGIRGISIAISFIIVTLLTVVLSELVPKAVTLQYTVPLASLTARPIYFIQTVLRPLVWVMDTMANITTRSLGLGRVNIEDVSVTAEELRHIAAESEASGHLTSRERTLILNSLTLGRRTAAEVMIPRLRVNYLDIQRSMPENLDAVSHFLFSRMPLCNGGMDKVIGVIYTKEFLTAFQETEDSSVLLLIVREPVFVPVNIPLDKLLTRFHDDKAHLLFLVDEHGSVSGIVTLTDVVNELVGPMHEGEDSRIVSRTDDAMIVRGEMPIVHLADHLNRPGWAGDADVRSVGGLMVARFGRVPRTGESFEIDGIKLIAHKSNSRVVEEVKVSLR